MAWNGEGSRDGMLKLSGIVGRSKSLLLFTLFRMNVAKVSRKSKEVSSQRKWEEREEREEAARK